MALLIKQQLVVDNGGYWEMELMGEVDITSAAEFRKALAEAFTEKPTDIVIDASELTYIDSTGLGVIIGAFGRMKEKGNKIIIENPRANVKKLLNITSLDRIFCPY